MSAWGSHGGCRRVASEGGHHSAAGAGAQADAARSAVPRQEHRPHLHAHAHPSLKDSPGTTVASHP